MLCLSYNFISLLQGSRRPFRTELRLQSARALPTPHLGCRIVDSFTYFAGELQFCHFALLCDRLLLNIQILPSTWGFVEIRGFRQGAGCSHEYSHILVQHIHKMFAQCGRFSKLLRESYGRVRYKVSSLCFNEP